MEVLWYVGYVILAFFGSLFAAILFDFFFFGGPATLTFYRLIRDHFRSRAAAHSDAGDVRDKDVVNGDHCHRDGDGADA